MQKNNKLLVTILLLIAALLGISMLQNGGFSMNELINDMLAGFIVFGFFILIIFLIRRFSPQNPNCPKRGPDPLVLKASG